VIRQTVGFLVAITRNVGDSELKLPSQLTADPVKGVKPRAPANIFTGHLLYHQLRIGKDAKGRGFCLGSILQSFQEGCIFSHVVVLVTDPLSNVDALATGLLDYNPNAGWPRTAVGPTVDMRDQGRHPLSGFRLSGAASTILVIDTMLQIEFARQENHGFTL
jgi:hypothetical protein